MNSSLGVLSMSGTFVTVALLWLEVGREDGSIELPLLKVLGRSDLDSVP
jgi:hypothetical protein